MLTLFRFNTYAQIISLAVILFLIRMPFMGLPLPMLNTELEYMLIGSKLNQGLSLYSGILTQVGPLACYFYSLVELWCGKNQLYYEYIATVCIFLQTLYFVYFVNKRNLFNEKNYVAGLFYLIIMFVSFDMNKLSPPLLANFFVLPAINILIQQIEKRNGIGEEIFESGIYMGIATLFYLPCGIFIIWVILGMLLFSSASFRQYFIVILAFLIPIFFAFLIFYLNNHSKEFVSVWLFNVRNIFDFTLLGLRDILLCYTIPFVVAVFGIIRLMGVHRYNSFQTRAHQLLVIYAIFAIFSLMLSQDLTPSNFIFITPFLAFYGAAYFIHSRKTILPEFLILLFFGAILSIMYVAIRGNKYTKRITTLSAYRISEQPLPEKYKDKSIFITGSQIDAYQSHKMATGYLSWKLAKLDFKNPNNYLSLVNVFTNFKKDYPEVIIDNENVMPKVFDNIPELNLKYQLVAKKIYELKN